MFKRTPAAIAQYEAMGVVVKAANELKIGYVLGGPVRTATAPQRPVSLRTQAAATERIAGRDKLAGKLAETWQTKTGFIKSTFALTRARATLDLRIGGPGVEEGGEMRARLLERVREALKTAGFTEHHDENTLAWRLELAHNDLHPEVQEIVSHVAPFGDKRVETTIPLETARHLFEASQKPYTLKILDGRLRQAAGVA